MYEESYDLKDTDFAPENYLELETKRSAGKINRTSYFYTFDSVTNGDATVKSLLSEGTTSSPYSKSYFVASPGVGAISSNASFGPGIVYGGLAFCGYTIFFYSYGVWLADGFAVRPVVCLNPKVTVDDLNVQTGIEEEPWTESAGGVRTPTGNFDSTKTIGNTQP